MSTTVFMRIAVVVIVAMTNGCGDDDDAAGSGDDGSGTGEATTVMLTIDLQEGFDGESVAVRVGEQVVFEADEVTTNPVIGLADSIVVEVDTGPQTVVVEVGADQTLATDVDVNADLFIGFNIDSGEVIESDQPFGYG